MSLKPLINRIAFVSGGTSGIGKAIAEELHNRGAKVIITGRNLENTKSIAHSIDSENVVGLECELSSSESINNCVRNAQEIGKIDILVNCAGYNKDALLLRMKDDEIDQLLLTNLSGTIKLTKGIAKSMIQKRSGNVISIGSVVGHLGNSGQCVYSASKAGLVGFTKSFAKEYATRGIRANLIEPGFISTGMIDHMSEAAKQAAFDKIPVQQFGTPEDVAKLCAFLANDEQSNYITGQTLRVDGGMS